jgi:cytochrome P450
MGKEVRSGLMSEVSRIYAALDGGLTPLSTVWSNAPTKAHRARDAARQEMNDIFGKVIAARRADPNPDKDFLQTMIDFRHVSRSRLT